MRHSQRSRRSPTVGKGQSQQRPALYDPVMCCQLMPTWRLLRRIAAQFYNLFLGPFEVLFCCLLAANQGYLPRDSFVPVMFMGIEHDLAQSAIFYSVTHGLPLPFLPRTGFLPKQPLLPHGKNQESGRAGITTRASRFQPHGSSRAKRIVALFLACDAPLAFATPPPTLLFYPILHPLSSYRGAAEATPQSRRRKPRTTRGFMQPLR